METIVASVSPQSLAQAAELLRQGQVVGMPTETVYGLAANALDGAAVARIFAAKGRPQDNPLIVHVDSVAMWETVVEHLTPAARRLIDAFCPGPLTIILPRGKRVADEVCAGLDTVAVRMPSHPAARALIKACGLPLAAPSANLSGSPSPTTAAHVLGDMDGRIPLILDGGDCGVGVESTVVTLAGEQPVLLRPGYITHEQLEQVLGCPVQLAHAVTHQLAAGEKAASPGMKYKHYAPRADVTILQGDLAQYRAFLQQHAAEGVWALCFEGEEEGLPVPAVTYGLAADDATQAHALFGALRRLDEVGAKTVYARCPSETGVGLAVYNRLLRAAAFRVVAL